MNKKQQNINEILDFIKREDLLKYVSSGSIAPFKLNFELLPEDFLRFAEQDLQIRKNHALVNSLSNVKRAIDCRVDSLLVLFGIFEQSSKDRWGFPSKIKFLKEAGVLAPTVLERINTKRNKLEHYYKIPLVEEVEDALDISRLFIESTDAFLNRTFDAFEWELEEIDSSWPWIKVLLKSHKSYFEITLIKSKDKEIKIKIPSSDTDNFIVVLSEWVKAVKRG
jgi:hypothetical protein